MTFFQIGDIIGNRRYGSNVNHHFACLGPHEGYGDLIGVMLTHSNEYGNVLLLREHFMINDNRGKPYEFQFDNTHMVSAQFIKKHEWGPYAKIGQLTDGGISFIRGQVEHLTPDYYFSLPSFRAGTRRRRRYT